MKLPDPNIIQPHTNVQSPNTPGGVWDEVEHYFPMRYQTNEPAILAWNKVGAGIYKPEGTYGIALQDEDLCLDADPRNYPIGRDVLSEWFSRFKLPPTRAIQTPSNGWHIRYRKPAGIRIRKEQKDFPGIEFRSKNHCIVGPSCYRDQKMPDGRHVIGYYQLVYGGPPILLPQHVLDALEQPPAASEKGAEGYSLLELSKFKGICQAADPAAPNSDRTRGLTAYKIACQGRDLNLSPETVFQTMGELWDWRNQPPLMDAHLWVQVQHAYQYAKNAPGAKSAEAVFEPPKLSIVPAEPTNITATTDFQHEAIRETLFQKMLTPLLDKKGFVVGIKNTQGNLIYILRNTKYWSGRLRYNQFADRIEIVGRPSWRQDQTNKDQTISDLDFDYIQGWLSATPEYMLEVPLGKIKSACQAAAAHYHPVRIYLQSLKWDGVPRLDTILPDTTGCANNAYTRAAGKCMMISAVKRIMEPGCKQDYLLVLESEQGTKKSTWVETLGGEWYSTGELIPNDKDTYQALRGKWFIELPEIDNTFSKAEFAWLKKTITTSSDTYRPSYARVAETVPRESIFIATLNPSASGEYLRDTENRRYWPIATGNFNIGKLQSTRDQYFAEAKVRYDLKEASWIDDPEVARLAKYEQEMRREKDPWTDIVQGWAAAKGSFSAYELYSILGFKGSDISSHARKRMHAVVKELGFEYNAGVRLWVKKKKTWKDLL